MSVLFREDSVALRVGQFTNALEPRHCGEKKTKTFTQDIINRPFWTEVGHRLLWTLAIWPAGFDSRDIRR